MNKIRKTAVGTTHALAVCRDCLWADDNYKTAEQSAHYHAATTGHTVSVERAQSWTYNQKRLAIERIEGVM